MFNSVLRWITFFGSRRALSGSHAWTILMIFVVGIRALRRLARSEPEVLYRTKVHAGDILVLGAKEPG